MERRSAIKTLGGALLIASLALGNTTTDKKKVLRIAHLTDIHLKNQFNAPERFTRCLHHVQQQSPKVDFRISDEKVSGEGCATAISRGPLF